MPPSSRDVDPSAAPAEISGVSRGLRFIEQLGASYASVAYLTVLGVLGYFQAISNPPLVAVVAIVAFGELVRRIDTGIPILQITAIIAVLQWLIGPTLYFMTGLTTGRYYMYVSEAEYFTFAIPGTAAFCIGLYLFGSTIHQKLVLEELDRRYFFDFGVLLNIVAFAATLVAERAPGGLAFFFHLCSQLKYVGAIYFLLSGHRYRYVLAAASCMTLFTSSAAAGRFHDLIIWMTLISTYWFAQFRFTLQYKLALIGAAALLVFIIQVIKQDYREKLSRGIPTSVPDEMWLIISGQRNLIENDILSLAAVRLNQGWIISAVMKNVPENEPFADGETIADAFESSLMPRFLSPDKKMAGGRENFRRFTGLPIGENTSMGISPLGEAYANFDVEGGIVFMLVYGLFFSGFFRMVASSTAKNPDFIFWIPLVFYQGIKAETEIVVVLNQLVKGLIVAYGGYFGLTEIAYPMVFGRQYAADQGAEEPAKN